VNGVLLAGLRGSPGVDRQHHSPAVSQRHSPMSIVQTSVSQTRDGQQSPAVANVLTAPGLSSVDTTNKTTSLGIYHVAAANY